MQAWALDSTSNVREMDIGLAYGAPFEFPAKRKFAIND